MDIIFFIYVRGNGGLEELSNLYVGRRVGIFKLDCYLIVWFLCLASLVYFFG